MGFGFGPGSDMMKDYNRNLKQLRDKKKSLKDFQDYNITKPYDKDNNLQRRPKSYENSLACPNCKTIFEFQQDICSQCGFPFNGTDKEKSVFIANEIMKKGKISDTQKHIRISRIILWTIGVFCLLYPLVFFKSNLIGVVFYIIYFAASLMFIGFGFLTYKKPLVAILIPLIIVVLYYISLAIVDLRHIYSGFLWKVIILTSLLIGLISTIKVNRIKKESVYLNEQKFTM